MARHLRRRDESRRIRPRSGDATVTFSNTPVAPVGIAEPVTCSFCDSGDTNGPGKPTSTLVSRTRTGSIVATTDGALDAAFTATKPPPPNVTATAAPIAAHRDRHRPRRLSLRTFSFIASLPSGRHRMSPNWQQPTSARRRRAALRVITVGSLRRGAPSRVWSAVLAVLGGSPEAGSLSASCARRRPPRTEAAAVGSNVRLRCGSRSRP